jgi:digeranylgeranylglycerophospholipid reductase
MRAETDVLIAGAGPGGLAATLWLRRAGVEVLLVEARDRVGHPARCAEIVTMDVFEEWDLEPRPGWIRSRFLAPGRKETGKGRLTIDRARVEHEVSQIAAGLGAEVAPATAVVGVGEFDGERRVVTLRSREGTRQVAARCVVAADGVSSVVARMAGVETFLGPNEVASGLAYRIEGAVLRDPEAMYKTSLPAEMAPPPCYFWVAPHGPDSANVGLGLLGRDGNRARRYLERMLETDGACRGGRVAETLAGLLPHKRPFERPYRDGLLIVGGAARMVHPVGGAGIRFAAGAGRAAAEQIASLGDRPATAGALAGYRERAEWIYGQLAEGWERLGRIRRAAGMEAP